jgi:hypothetical protein
MPKRRAIVMAKRASLATKSGPKKKAAKKPAKAARKAEGKKAAKKAADAAPRHMQTRINDSGWYALKVLAAEQRSSLQEITVEALNDLLRKYRKSAVVESPFGG